MVSGKKRGARFFKRLGTVRLFNKSISGYFFVTNIILFIMAKIINIRKL